MTKNMKAFLAFCLLLAVGTVSAQDICKVNPGRCKVLEDSAGVTMMRITLKPGEKLNTHTHPLNMGYVLKGGLYKWTYVNGKTEESLMKAGDHFTGGPETAHHSWNAGNTVLEFILIEKHR